MPPLIPAAKFLPGPADDHDAPGRHVLAAVVADALHDRQRAAVADRKTLAGDASHVGLAAGRAIQAHVADDDVLVRRERGLPRREHDELAARQPLAPVVVRIPLEAERDAARHERAEALARRAGEVHANRVVRQTLAAVPPRDLRPQHRAHGPMLVADRQRDQRPAARVSSDGSACSMSSLSRARARP